MKSSYGIAFACLLALTAGFAATQTQAEPARLFSPVPDSLIQQTKAKGGQKNCNDICARRCSSGSGNCMSTCLSRCK